MKTHDQKQALRTRILDTLKNSSALALTDAPAEALLVSAEYSRAKVVLAYVSMQDELPTNKVLRAVLESGRTLLLPRVSSKSAAMSLHRVQDLDADLESSKLGFRQPRKELSAVEPRDIDLIVAPGVVFDERGYRLGRGAGHYDRLLSTPGLRATVVALALEEQMVKEVPVEAHDRPVQVVFTPSRVIRFGGIS